MGTDVPAELGIRPDGRGGIEIIAVDRTENQPVRRQGRDAHAPASPITLSIFAVIVCIGDRFNTPTVVQAVLTSRQPPVRVSHSDRLMAYTLLSFHGPMADASP